jgi:peptidyl-tRNA hydrolase, PTH1 family
MKLIVGLGNPGRKYVGTRHNVGYAVAEELARRHGQGKARTAFEAEVADAEVAGQRALLVCPQTFMNLSGHSVVKARDFYKLENSDILIICDDFHLPVAKLRVRAKGSSGGQKGLADIIRHLGTEEVPRLRIGVGEVPAGRSAADFVLSKFSKQELAEIEPAIWRAADAAAVWAAQGIQECMNRYNSPL